MGGGGVPTSSFGSVFITLQQFPVHVYGAFIGKHLR